MNQENLIQGVTNNENGYREFSIEDIKRLRGVFDSKQFQFFLFRNFIEVQKAEISGRIYLIYTIDL